MPQDTEDDGLLKISHGEHKSDADENADPPLANNQVVGQPSVPVPAEPVPPPNNFASQLVVPVESQPVEPQLPAPQPENTFANPNPQPESPSLPQQPVQAQAPPRANWPEFRRQPARPVQTADFFKSPVAPLNGSAPISPNFAPPKGRKGSRLVLIVVILLFVLGGGAYAYTKFFGPPTPDQAFNNALTHALSTKNVTQKQTEAEDSNTATIRYDVSNIKDPRVETDITLDFAGSKEQFNGYGTFQNSYVEFVKSDTLIVNKQLLNQWVQVRKDSKLPALHDFVYDAVYDPNYAFFGDYIFGNFSASDRASLVNYVTQQGIYKYDAAKVTKEKLGSTDVYVYNVTTDTAKLKAYNQKVAALAGVTNSDRNDLFSALDSSTQAKLYISVNNSQLLKVVTKDNNQTATTTYGSFGSTSAGAEPTPTTQLAEFFAANTSKQ